MAERRTRKTGDDPGVLASLPATRPQRLGGRRRSSATTKPAATATARAASTPTRRKPAAKGAAAAKARGAKSAKPKAAAKRKPAPQPTAISEATGRKPQSVRPGASGLDAPAKKAAAQRTPVPARTPSGVELVSTVVQAAGELAQVGLSIGGQVLKRAVERLPKP